ncbi:MAG: adenosylcobinamide-GDP ribazoletransferase [Halobacteriales archaeon]
MALIAALRGGVTFLTRLPIATRDDDWDAFRTTPAVMPAVGYLIGAILGVVFLFDLPASGTVGLFLATLYLLTGITHIDGLADLGDGAVVHGDADRRRTVMRDTDTGVGGVLAIALVIAELALAVLALTNLPTVVAVGIVIAAEVGAKATMALCTCRYTPGHEGLGAELLDTNEPTAWPPIVVVTLPIVVVGPPGSVVALLGAGGVGWFLATWAVRRLDGLSGDVLGAINELARVVALHAGVIAWMRL